MSARRISSIDIAFEVKTSSIVNLVEWRWSIEALAWESRAGREVRFGLVF